MRHLGTVFTVRTSGLSQDGEWNMPLPYVCVCGNGPTARKALLGILRAFAQKPALWMKRRWIGGTSRCPAITFPCP